MAKLSDLLSFIDSRKRVVGRNLSDLVSNPLDYLQKVVERSPETIKEYVNDPMNFIGGGIGKTAWHGSPHRFDKFELSKIGTGEGAQAYGHGLYLAESPSVAKSYKEALSAGRGVGDDDTIARVLDLVGGDRAKAANTLRQRAEYANIPGGKEKLLGMADKIDQGFDPRGHLYKTDIPDEAVARFLDWDKPLSQQSPDVKAAIGLDKNPNASIKDWTGKEFYVRTGGQLGEPTSSSRAAAEHLRKKGIQGIRYLDAGSRAGGGTSNFVVFDPEMIRILERNNTPTGSQPWTPGEWNR